MSEILGLRTPDAAATSARILEPNFSVVTDYVPGLLSYISLDRRFLFANRCYSEWFKRPQNEFVGKTVYEVLGTAAYERVKPYLDLAFSGQIPPPFERYHSYDGETSRFVRTSMFPDRDFDGTVKGVVVLVEDITDKKRAEDAEKDLERQLTLLIEASGTLLASPQTADVLKTVLGLAKRFIDADAYSVWRNTGNLWQIVSSEGLSAGYDSSMIVSTHEMRSLEPIVVEDVDREAFVERRREAYKAEGIRSLITVPLSINNTISGTLVFYYRKPRRFSRLEVRVSSALGNLAAAAITSADLYERQIHLRKVAEYNEQRASFLAEAGHILSSSLDFEQTLAAIVDLTVPRFADCAAVELLDESGESRLVALKHCNPDKLEFVKDFRQRFPSLDDDIAKVALKTGEPLFIDYIPDEVFVERARSPEHLEALRYFGLRSLILAPLSVNGRIFGLLTLVAAESGRRYSQEDYAFVQELARRAATAMDNARLFTDSSEAQDALRRANAELSRANEDLNQFAYSASHDLQEPLRMLIVYSQLLERRCKEALTGPGRDYLSFIVDGARRMEMLLSDLLAYMQVVNIGRQHVEPVDANTIITGVLDTLAVSIQESKAKVTVETFPPLPLQEFHLVQLFQNLISNAVKYRSERAPEIHISCKPLEGQWMICVNDNGIGIPPEYCDEVFKVFKRLHDKDKYPGTGIGLAICQKIVERYGGKIWIESALGQGSTVCITLPINP